MWLMAPGAVARCTTASCVIGSVNQTVAKLNGQDGRMIASQQADQGADRQVGAEYDGNAGEDLLGVVAEPCLGFPEHRGGALRP
jgi:hypothetical protein